MQVVKLRSQHFIAHLSPRHLGWLTGGIFVLLAASSSRVAAQLPVTETFTNSSVIGPWNFGVGNGTSDPPCLTAAPLTASPAPQPSGTGFIPGCPNDTTNTGRLPENPGSGALRLTPSKTQQAGFVIYDRPIPAGQGLEITFQYYTYNGNGADGVSFFLINGAVTPGRAGGFGGSLGYAPRTDAAPPLNGIEGGYVGIGLDEFGNFSNPTEGRLGGPGQRPDSVAIRGAGERTTGYNFVSGRESPQSIDCPAATSRTDFCNPGNPASGPVLRTARVTLTPQNTISLEVDFGSGFVALVPPVNLSTLPDQPPFPETFKFGFGSSTGDSRNIHEIQNLSITSLVPPVADLSITKQTEATVVNPNDSITYTITVNNNGPAAVFDARVTDPIDPTRLSNVSWTCTATAGSSCPESGSGDINTTINLTTDGQATFTVTATVLNTATGNLQNTANVALPPGPPNLTDPTPENNTATVTIPINGPSVTASKTVQLANDADNNGVVSGNDILEYTITITNTGNAPATGVTFSDTPDPNTDLVVGSVTSSAGTVTSGNNPGNTTVGVNIGRIPPGNANNTRTIVYQVRVKNPLNSSVTQLSNQGTVSGTNFPNIPTNNPTTAPPNDATTIPVGGTGAPNIVATKSDALAVDADSNGFPSPGDTLEYTVTVGNTGAVNGTNVQLIDPIPANTQYVPNSLQIENVPQTDNPGDDRADNDSANNQLVFRLGTGANATTGGTLNVGASTTVKFRVTIANPLPAGVTQIRNQATATGGNFSNTISTSPNAASGEEATVTPITPNLRLVKRITRVNTTTYSSFVDDPRDDNDTAPGWSGLPPIGIPELGSQTPLQSGDEVEYTIYFLSDGGQPATNVKVCDPIPAGTTFIADSFGPGSGILLNQAGTATPQTNFPDTDRGTYFSPLAPVTAPCPDLNNPNGSVFVPLGNVAPNNTGFVRFRVKIN